MYILESIRSIIPEKPIVHNREVNSGFGSVGLWPPWPELPVAPCGKTIFMNIEVRNPATGTLSGQVRLSTEDEIRAAATRARSAQAVWADTPIRQRARLLVNFHDRLFARETEVLNTIQSETGKSRKDAFGELCTLAGTARYYAYHGPRHLNERRLRGGIPLVTGSRVVWKPYPLTGFISPWNYPLLLSMGDMLPALVAGSAALLKPSERTPLSAELGRAILVQAGCDPDLVGIVHGGPNLTSSLIREVDYLAFTGGSKTGQAVRVAAATAMIDCSLELGGKNPMIVLSGTRVDQAVKSLVAAASTNAGQACIGIERVYVASSMYEEFLEKNGHADGRGQGGLVDGMGCRYRKSYRCGPPENHLQTDRRCRQSRSEDHDRGQGATRPWTRLHCAYAPRRRTSRRIDFQRGNVWSRSFCGAGCKHRGSH